MRIYEIIKTRYRPKPKLKVVSKRKVPLKGPYAPPPKPLPKPKPLTPTPLQVKQSQQKKLQAYANVVQRTLSPNRTTANQNTIKPQAAVASSHPPPARSEEEMTDFMKHIRGENLGKPGF